MAETIVRFGLSIPYAVDPELQLVILLEAMDDLIAMIEEESVGIKDVTWYVRRIYPDEDFVSHSYRLILEYRKAV